MQLGASDDEPLWSRNAGGTTTRRRDMYPLMKDCDTDAEEVSTAGSDMDIEVEYGARVVPLQVLGRRRRAARSHRRATRHATEETVLTTIRLVREVDELRRHRDELMALHYARVLNSDRRDLTLNTTLEYFDTFRSGFTGPQLPDMFNFFDTRLERDVFAYGGGDLGLDTWVEQWKRYTRLYPSISMRLRSMAHTQLLESLDQLALAHSDPTMTTSIVETQAFLDGVISRQAIYTVLPHLRQREDLVQKLLGKQISIPMILRFYYNSAGRVHRYDFEGDYFQAFSNVEGVSLVDLAQITEHLALGDNTTVADIVELEDESMESGRSTPAPE